MCVCVRARALIAGFLFLYICPNWYIFSIVSLKLLHIFILPHHLSFVAVSVFPRIGTSSQTFLL